MKLKIATSTLVIMAVLIGGSMSATEWARIHQSSVNKTGDEQLVELFYQHQDKFECIVGYLLKKEVSYTGANCFEVDKESGVVSYRYYVENEWQEEIITDETLKKEVIFLVRYHGFYISKRSNGINFASNSFTNSRISYYYDKADAEKSMRAICLTGNWFFVEHLGV